MRLWLNQGHLNRWRGGDQVLGDRGTADAATDDDNPRLGLACCQSRAEGREGHCARQAAELSTRPLLHGLTERGRLLHQAGHAAARTFVQNAEALSHSFVSHGMPATFLADLNAEIDTLEQALQHRVVGKDAHIAAS